MSSSQLVPGAAADAAAVVRLRDAAAEWLLSRGIEQWRPGEATAAGVAARADAGQLFVVREGDQVVAAVVIVPSDTEVWGPRADDAGYLHTLVIDRRRAGEGLGRRVLDLAEARIAAQGGSRARLDCAAANPGLTSYYRHAGYHQVGLRSFPPETGWTPVALFEKPLPARPPRPPAAPR
jgi:ribosomal protein S18 acetylase RimI-like enzyme